MYVRGPDLLEVHYRGSAASPRLVATGPAVEARGVQLPHPESPVEEGDGDATFRVGLMDPAKPLVLTLEDGTSEWDLTPGERSAVWLLDGEPAVYDEPTRLLTIHSSRAATFLGRYRPWPRLRATGPAARDGARAPDAWSSTEATYHVPVSDDESSVTLQLEGQSGALEVTRGAEGWQAEHELPLA
jgi:hypothetical protein